jgi:Rieske Fe-S protein
MDEHEVSRRSLLVTGCGALCAQAVGCGTGVDSIGQLPQTIAAGPVSSLAVGTLHAVAGDPVAIARDSAGVYAMSLICTHAGCDMSSDASFSFIACGCHGSVFNAQGNVLRGPAFQPLAHFAVTQDAAGQLIIHTDQLVPSSTRLGVS